MTPAQPARLVLILLFACLASPAATAAEVFTWKDDQGVTHYSQWAPDDVSIVSNLSTLVVNADNSPGYRPEEDPYSIANQAKRMNETWKVLEERKEARQKEKQAAQQKAASAMPPSYERNEYYAPPWYYRPVFRPGHRPRPPIHRPPHIQPMHPRQPAAAVRFAPDPMRSAQIGVRRSTSSAPVSAPR